MTTSQFTLYQGAARLLKHAPLSTVTDDIPLRYALDAVWGDGALNYCLEEGLWWFAMRTSRLDYDPAFTAPFGFRYRFEHPSDWVRTSAVAQDEYFAVPLTRVSDEAGSWFADMTPIYVSYVSNDAAYGLDMNKWPQTFTMLVEAYLALQVAPGLTASGSLIEELEKVYKKRLTDARSKAAMTESVKFLPQGSWVRSRYGRRAVLDRGNTSSLYG